MPRSQYHLQPPSPAHVGPEAGGALGALSLTPRSLHGEGGWLRSWLWCPFLESPAWGTEAQGTLPLPANLHHLGCVHEEEQIQGP